MNPMDAEIALALGPCADYEFDLVELGERTLAPERAVQVEEHVAQCARCRAHLAELSALDAALATSLPAPELPADFDARLAQRIAALQRSPDRLAALAAAEREHAQLRTALGHALGWRTVLNGAAFGAVTGGALLALDEVAPGLLQASGLVPAGASASIMYSLLLAATCVVGGLAFARRIAGGALLRGVG